MKMKLALVVPQIDNDVNSYKNMDRQVLPLGVYTLKSYLKDYYQETIVIDAITNHYDEKEIIEIIQKEKCNIVGISGITNRYYNSVISVAQNVKVNTDIEYVFVGGAIATYCYDELLIEKSIDFVIRGEGELVIKKLLDHLTNNESFTSLNGICYVDKLSGQVIANSFEKRLREFDHFREDKYNFSKKIISEFITGARSYVIMASRGCKGNCSFCQVPTYYGERGVWWRAPEDVAKEITFAVTAWGVRRVNFQDSNFLCNLDWLDQFIIEIKKRNTKFKFNIFADAESIEPVILDRLKEIGLYQVFVGLETGSESRFKQINKKAKYSDNQFAIDILREKRMKILPGYILYFPDSTMEEIIESVKWFDKNKLVKPSMFFNKMDLWYGTSMFERLNKQNYITKISINDGIDYSFLDKRVEVLYDYMLICLDVYKELWKKITEQDGRRRQLMNDVVYDLISKDIHQDKYHDLAVRLDEYYSKGGKYTFGRSSKNQELLNSIIRDYFTKAVDVVQEETCETEECRKMMKQYARSLINNCSGFEWIEENRYMEMKHQIHKDLVI